MCLVNILCFIQPSQKGRVSEPSIIHHEPQNNNFSLAQHMMDTYAMHFHKLYAPVPNSHALNTRLEHIINAYPFCGDRDPLYRYG